MSPLQYAVLAHLAVLGAAAGSGESCGSSGCDVEDDDTGLLSIKKVGRHVGEHNASVALKQSPTCGIDTPAKFKTEWDRLRIHGGPAIDCVSADIYASVIYGGCNDEYLYPQTADKAWVFGKADLELMLDYQGTWGATEPGKATAAADVLVGFGPPALADAITDQCMAVFTLPPTLAPTVPTFVYWFSYLAKSNYIIPYLVVKGITYAYSSTKSKKGLLSIFEKMTGCSAKELRKSGDLKGCRKPVKKVMQALDNVRQQGPNCVNVFFTQDGWSIADWGAVRMMLNYCFDVNPWNTGIGLGWNTYPNPSICKKPSEQNGNDLYTGEEYVIPNTMKWTDFPSHEKIEMAPASKQLTADIAENGFC
mmetsp:Transcript_126516/g.393813  ORF Transcript_126516/g.393813 Transcript_126516/m.393813 type:complete len:364 (+) Transcript_126516:104-1195(+)